jgi:hypothetical protein
VNTSTQARSTKQTTTTSDPASTPTDPEAQFVWELGAFLAKREGLPPGPFPTQPEAESWLGEHWRDVKDAGVGSVVLAEAGTSVYVMDLESGFVTYTGPASR